MSITEQNLTTLNRNSQQYILDFILTTALQSYWKNQGTDGLVLKISKYIAYRQQVLQYHSMNNSIKMKLQRGTLLLMPA